VTNNRCSNIRWGRKVVRKPKKQYCCSDFEDSIDIGELEKDSNNIWNLVCSVTGRYEFYINNCPWCGTNLDHAPKTLPKNSNVTYDGRVIDGT
jgi:hypothetical protein